MIRTQSGILRLAAGIALLAATVAVRAAQPITSTGDVAGKLLITEVNRSGGNSNYYDAVEVLNLSPIEWDLTNVFITECAPDGAQTSGDSHRFPNGSTIKPYAMAIAFLDRDVTQAKIDTIPT